ncbi:MAG: hypothetical protein JSW27_07575 [Phycisphaerales bacterium]|nr:MAG: hypothetical protein JSW27_07575 [Phycisphaerales bacterium]
MMLKRISMIVAAGLICLTTLSSQASQTVVIGDFEGPGSAQYDGWVNNGALSWFAGDDVGAIWSSTGSGSAAILFESNVGFQWTMQLSDTVLAQLADNTEPGTGRLMADVYWQSSDWNGSGWARWETASFNSAVTGWQQTDDSLMSDTDSPGFPGLWDTTDWGASNERTITWDFSTLLAAYSPQDILDGGWVQLNLSVNGNTGADTTGIFYIDNIRMVVPDSEPVTVPVPGALALVGVGSLLTMVHRRRT